MPTVFTVGHSSHSLERFLELLRQHGIQIVVDVRSRPYSRHVPHFTKAPLERALAQHGLRYVFLGRVLGGRPEGAEHYDAEGRLDVERRQAQLDFQMGITVVLDLEREGRVALMCGEEDPTECHRRHLVGHFLFDQGVEVIHIRGDGRLQNEQELRRGAANQLSLFERADD
jgi:uncharacterized protein (DUF488 family)